MSLFNSFAKTIEDLPVSGIVGVLGLQQRMIEDDMKLNRPLPQAEAHSILNFCRFVEAARQGKKVGAASLPLEHVVVYQAVIQKLIGAKELSGNAGKQFHETFSNATLRAH